MTKDKLKQKCTERAKIFQQAMESCHSSSPIDCIEWFADRIAELEAQIEKMKSQYDYAFNQLCKSREIICLMLSQHKNKKEIDYSTKERGEKLLKQGVYKYD